MTSSFPPSLHMSDCDSDFDAVSDSLEVGAKSTSIDSSDRKSDVKVNSDTVHTKTRLDRTKRDRTKQNQTRCCRPPVPVPGRDSAGIG